MNPHFICDCQNAKLKNIAAALFAAMYELEHVPGVGKTGPDMGTLIAAEKAGTVYDYPEYHQAQKAWLILEGARK